MEDTYKLTETSTPTC